MLAIEADDRVCSRLGLIQRVFHQLLSALRFRLSLLWLMALRGCVLLTELDLVLCRLRGLLLLHDHLLRLLGSWYGRISARRMISLVKRLLLHMLNLRRPDACTLCLTFHFLPEYLRKVCLLA